MRSENLLRPMKYIKTLFYVNKVDTFIKNSQAFTASQKVKQMSLINERQQ